MDIEIVEAEIGKVVEIEETIHMWQMPFVMGKDYDQLYTYLKSADCESDEAPYARYVGIDIAAETSQGFFGMLIDMIFKKWHFFAGVPVAKELEGEKRIKPAFVEKQKYIQTMHKGPYHKVGETYKAIYKWSQEQQLELGDQSIEFYLNDPRETEKKDLETRVMVQVKP
ncbi:MAG: GyrI-like domain-containing protein [Gammaproteobacteria bacterium]|nr:MAG: GyrI-like domain-containing protein [Gammaproteobacteria bacterium]